MKKLNVFPHWGPCFGCESQEDLNDDLVCESCQKRVGWNAQVPRKIILRKVVSQPIAEKPSEELNTVIDPKGKGVA